MSGDDTNSEGDESVVSDELAARVLDKVRDFVATLDDAERAVFAALVAPGIASAYAPENADVAGFSMQEWSPQRLPDALAARIRHQRLRAELD